MKKWILISLLCTGCKEIAKSDSESKAPAMINSQGCSVSKSRGVLSVTCADGTSASTAAPSVHIKSGAADYPNLVVIGISTTFPAVLNTTSGNVLTYDGDGNKSVATQTFFDGPACTGNAYFSATGINVKNRVFLNDQAWPGGAQALRATSYAHPFIPLQSKFTGGVCSANIASMNSLLKVEAMTLDASDPLTLAQPFEVISE